MGLLENLRDGRFLLHQLIKHKAILFAVITTLLFGCANTFSGFITPNNQYILLAKENKEKTSASFAALKIVSQGKTTNDVLKYEWLLMNDGNNVIGIEKQNYKFGSTTTVGRHGIGFNGFRFSWRPSRVEGEGLISAIGERKAMVTYCLTEREALWVVNIEQEIVQLKQKGRCKIEKERSWLELEEGEFK